MILQRKTSNIPPLTLDGYMFNLATPDHFINRELNIFFLKAKFL